MNSELHTSQARLLGVLALAAVERLGGDGVLFAAADDRLRECKVVRVGDIAVVDQPADDSGPRTVSVYLIGEGAKFLLYSLQWHSAAPDLHLARDPRDWFGVVSMTLLDALAKSDPALRASLRACAAPPQ